MYLYRMCTNVDGFLGCRACEVEETRMSFQVQVRLTIVLVSLLRRFHNLGCLWVLTCSVS